MPDKKPDKKGGKKEEKPAPNNNLAYVIVGWVVALLILLTQGLPFIAGYFGVESTGDEGVFDPRFVSAFKHMLIGFISSVQAVSAFISLLFIIGIIYTKFRMGQLERAKALKLKVKKAEEKKVERDAVTENRKWLKILDHVSSDNPSDWRLSILEADILLAELLEKMGYHGESIGEKLKSVERSDFETIDLAWEAHKVRNLIAHEGSNFPLSQREAKRVIGLFEEVFKEFYFV